MREGWEDGKVSIGEQEQEEENVFKAKQRQKDFSASHSNRSRKPCSEADVALACLAFLALGQSQCQPFWRAGQHEAFRGEARRRVDFL